MKKKPYITPQNKLKHLEWCREKVGWGSKWKQIVFSEEKKLNLDGPDGARYYWHDIRKEERFFSKHHFGVETVMIWAAFSSKWKSKLAYISPCITSEDYKAVLSTYIKPSWRRIGGKKATFMHNNAPIHKAGTIKTWLQSNEISVLDWCPYSPDLNPLKMFGGHLLVNFTQKQSNSIQ